jgi:hypothetical protein
MERVEFEDNENVVDVEDQTLATNGEAEMSETCSMNRATKEFSNVLYFLEDKSPQLEMLKKNEHKEKVEKIGEEFIEEQKCITHEEAKNSINDLELGESSLQQKKEEEGGVIINEPTRQSFKETTRPNGRVDI